MNMNSLGEVLPESPSLICSSASTSPLSSASSPTSDPFFTQVLPAAPPSTPNNQSFCTASNGVEDSRFKERSALEEYCGLGSTRRSYEASSEESPNVLQHGLMKRPKPHSMFLDEVKKHELEAEIEDWRNAKQMEIMERLKWKEADRSKWEHKHITKAMEETKKFESKLEKKRAKELDKFQKRISTTEAEAHKKLAKVRRETIEKVAAISKVSSKAFATKNSPCIKPTRLY